MLVFFKGVKDDTEGSTELINTPKLKSWMKRGSIFDQARNVILTKNYLGKDIDPAEVKKLLTSNRTEWDPNLTTHKEIIKVSDEVSVIHVALKSPNIFFQPRDFIEKRVQLTEDGVLYEYYSSVPEAILPPANGYIRADTIFSVNIFTVEDGECVYYCIYQNDIKVCLF